MGIAIRTEHLSKEYRLGVINHGMFYKDMQSWIARKLGRPDPHAKIGEERFADQRDRFWALKDVNFDIEEGDRIGIIGSNGAGKSTLLKILSTITAPTEGCVKIRGRVASLLEVGTGFHGELTGRENIYLNGAILGMKKREIDRKLDEIISFSGIEQHVDTPVKRYSSGMYVRLAFAVAAHLDSEILLADEVLAVGDSDFQKKAIGKMQDLSAGQGRTVLFVSHNLPSVRQLCRKGIVLEKGRILFSGNIENSIKRYLQGDRGRISVLDSQSRELRRGPIEVLEMSIRDENGKPIQRSLENSERLFLSIVFDYKSIDPIFTIGFSMFNSSGEYIYRSLTTDVDSKANAGLRIGKNVIECEVPIVFLRSDEYTINVDCSIHNEEWIINPEMDREFSLSFTIVNTAFGAMQSTRGKIAPCIIWKINQA